VARNVRIVTGVPGQIERQQELADALTVRALRSRVPQQGGPVQVKMSPWEGVAQLGEAWIASRARGKADDLASADVERQKAANEAMIRQLAGEQGPRRLTEQGQPTGAPIEAPLDMETGRPMLLSDKAQTLAAAMGGMDPYQSGTALGGAMMQQALSTPKYERVDLGDSIGVVDERGQVIHRIPKGATPDTRVREEGANQRHQIPSGSAQLGANVSMRGQDISAGTAARGQNLTYDAALRGQEAAAARPQAEAAAAQAAKAGEVEKVWNMYSTAREGVMGGLSNTSTGPIAGRIPAVTANQQIAEGGVAAMAPVLKQLFRVAGEGVFTDRDQALLLDMVPKRTDRPDAREAKMANIDAIVRAKLGLPPEQAMPSAAPADPAVSDRARGYYERRP
jgi:hypothetical protein